MAKPLDPPAATCFARATELAPDWDEANRQLFNALFDAGKQDEAEAAVRKFLAHKPDDLGAVTSVASLLSEQGRADEAAEFWLRALAINPLDRPTRMRAADAVLAQARHKLAGNSAAEAAAVLDRQVALVEEHDPADGAGLRSVILVKQGQAGEAAEFLRRALAFPGARLAAAYRIMVDSQLTRLKPADKRDAEGLFAAALAPPPRPHEVNLLIGAYDAYHRAGITYRGQKSHEKKVLDQVGRCHGADAPELDFERLASNLVFRKEIKRAKALTEACIKRFKANPHFLLVRSEIGLETNEVIFKVEDRLRKARRAAEKSNEPRHKALLNRIDELLKEMTSRYGFLDVFFNRERW
jgi:tetratricopeptide (TPR) repeat protein